MTARYGIESNREREDGGRQGRRETERQQGMLDNTEPAGNINKRVAVGETRPFVGSLSESVGLPTPLEAPEENTAPTVDIELAS